jgi:hypothetical protein
MQGTITKILVFMLGIAGFKADVMICDGDIKGVLASISLKKQSTHYDFGVSNNFNVVPELESNLYICKPALVKISFQGSAWLKSGTNFFIQILVNDRLIIGDKIIPNVPNSVTAKDISESGGYFYTSGSDFLHVIASKFALVNLAPGKYKFDVGVRTTDTTATLRHGIVTVEMMEYGKDANIGFDLYDEHGAVFNNAH